VPSSSAVGGYLFLSDRQRRHRRAGPPEGPLSSSEDVGPTLMLTDNKGEDGRELRIQRRSPSPAGRPASTKCRHVKVTSAKGRNVVLEKTDRTPTITMTVSRLRARSTCVIV